ncbi:RNA-binding S4 domain-containing protein [Actibacterium sp. XHP0104]|uniref:RNA-binding S4 domain-containing protein n=1 Tax=Actibacterium sp. XHP0104 TaxID=2984335 RepID=UPI0021E7BAC7|nr:RNA-binding S4 domain-containing protein [Actibacterium sp. XHP0104]MCV2881444.1 RNA-binding S4 domain-containing protein [Actibacterium sp. XHP0104]
MSDGDRPAIRLDKWLWHARFFKTRTLAARVVSAGHLRLNSVKMSKPGHRVVPGDVLTFPQGAVIRVVRVLAPGTRRGPAPEAQALYADLMADKDAVPGRAENPGSDQPGA